MKRSSLITSFNRDRAVWKTEFPRDRAPPSFFGRNALRTANKAKADNLEAIELFDIFRGQGIPAGQKSVAYAFNYRHPERTLKDKEVDKAHTKVIEQLKSRLKATVR